MKNKKTLIVLCGILAVLLIAMLCIKGVENHKEKIKTANEIVVAFDEEDVTSFSWKRSGKEFAFTKTDGTWVYDKDANFPVNQTAVDDMLNLVKGYSCSFIIEEPESLSNYELTNPKLKISVKTNDQEYEISFGGYSTMDEERYFSIGDGNVYLAADDVYDDFDCSESDFAQLDDLPVAKTVNSLEISGENNIKIVYKEDAGYCYSNEYTYYLYEGGAYKQLSNSIAKSLVQELTKMDLDDYVLYDADDEDLEKYNLKDPMIKLVLDYNDADGNQQSFTLNLASNGDDAYAAIPGSSYIYEIDEDVYETFADASYGTLKPREIVDIDWNNVSSITAKLDGETYTVNVDESKYSYGDIELDEDTVDDLLDALEELAIESVTTDSAVKKLEIEVKLALNNEDYPSYAFSVYQYDSKNCIVKIDGKIYGLAPRSSVVDLIEAFNSIILN